MPAGNKSSRDFPFIPDMAYGERNASCFNSREFLPLRRLQTGLIFQAAPLAEPALIHLFRMQIAFDDRTVGGGKSDDADVHLLVRIVQFGRP